MSTEKPCPLKCLPGGCKAKVMQIIGSPAVRSRLNALGFTPNTRIEVLDNASGRQVVKVRGCSLVLDEEFAGGIICEPVD